MAIPADISKMFTNQNDSLATLSNSSPVLLVFLRHFGCVFCREALEDIQRQRAHIESEGVRIVMVHMADEETAREYFMRYNLEDIDRVSDPACKFYMKFGLVKGNFKQLFGLRSWIRGFDAGVLQGHGVGKMLGDGFQMPGVFLIQKTKVVNEFVHENASDRPDYLQMLACAS